MYVDRTELSVVGVTAVSMKEFFFFLLQELNVFS